MATVPNYLLMTPKTGSVIFSPRPEPTIPKFIFPSANDSSSLEPVDLKSRANQIPEEVPMLKMTHQQHTNSDSEGESAAGSNWKSGDKSAKPQPTQRKSLKLQTETYVNVPSPIMNSPYKTKDAVSNPGYLAFSKVRETST